MPLVPAAISGTDRLSRLGPLRVRYGKPIPLDDLEGPGPVGGGARGDQPADGGDQPARRGPVSRPLLVVDGDSLAHRAYHALPKSMRRAEGKPSNALVGFSNFLMRLWQAEEPRAVARRLGHAHRADVQARAVRRLPGWSRVRRRAPRAARSPARARALVRVRRCEGRRATRPTTFSRLRWSTKRNRAATSVVVTSDRDSFQLASEHTTILQPTRGVSELARVGPAEVRERYSVDPAQVPDFIALRGDPSDKIPGAPRRRPEDGRESAGAVRDARGDARGRPVRGAGGGTSAVSANGDSGRLRPPTSPRRPDPEMDGGVLLRKAAGNERAGRQDRRAGCVGAVRRSTS